MEQEFSEALFTRVKEIPRDPVFGLQEEFATDSRKHKINLTIGVTLEEDGSPPKILHSVHLAEKKLLEGEKTKVYLGIEGDVEYTGETGKFIFGEAYSDSIYGGQSVGGTGALRILGEFLNNEISSRISLSNPTWPNHLQIFTKLGFEIDHYPYYETGFDFPKMRDHLKKLPPKTIVLLHASCHNPTGRDLSFDQWKELSSLFHEKKLIPFFDSAYQGFGEGIKEDVKAIHLFVEEGHVCFVAHSYSKSMSIYAERVGAYFVVMRDNKMRDLVRRNISSLIRTTYSNPPKHGASVAKMILQNHALKEDWLKEVEEIRRRMIATRTKLAKSLTASSGKDFSFIEKGQGFFTLLGLSPAQIEQLKKESAIYIGGKSRINLSAINESNLGYLTSHIAKCIV